MLRTLIILPDGTEVFSGTGTINAIKSATITECVNGAQELLPGSTCSNMIEAKLITPAGGLSLAAGDEIEVYKVDDSGTRQKVGLFTLEKPTRSGANTMSLTAYDRISWLDKDLSSWVAALAEWPYRLDNFAQMVCEACGLELVMGQDIASFDYLIQRFSADGLTGRQLMQWVGEILGRFCRATPDGLVEFAWYTEFNHAMIGATSASGGVVVSDDGKGNISIEMPGEVSDDGAGNVVIESSAIRVVDNGNGEVLLQTGKSIPFYGNSLSYEDYSVAPIAKVQLRQNDEDVGTVYPDIAETVNTYVVTGNYLLTAASAETLKPIAKALYEHLHGITYTPCKVTIPAGSGICAGSIVQIVDLNGNQITSYVMERKIDGQKETLTCTGSATRDSSSAVNSRQFKALEGKVLNMKTDVDGIKVENKNTAGQVASVKLDLEGIRSQVNTQESEKNMLMERLTKVEQTANSVSISVQKIQSVGATKVVTETGYGFTDAGIVIHKEGEQIKNLIDNKGIYVTRSGEPMLTADANGVVGTDMTVRNYLIVGENARFEDYNDGKDGKRTACFWIGGN